jgi:uncharacterized protein YjbJ (UPF0337 family)
MVTREQMSGNWHAVIGKVKEKYGQITSDDLTKVEGNMDQLLGLIERKAGQTREQAEEFLSSFYDKVEGTFRQASEKGYQACNQASEMLDEGMKQVGQKATEGYEYAKDTVARRPAESLVVAAGLGMLAGIAIGVSIYSKSRSKS